MFLQFMPKPLLTPDQVELLRRDSVVSDEAAREGRTLRGLGIESTSMQAIVPSYLYRFRRTGQFQRRHGLKSAYPGASLPPDSIRDGRRFADKDMRQL
jgi:hypothetical protein